MLKHLSTKKTPSLGYFTDEFYQILRKEVIPISRSLLEIEEEGTLLKPFYDACSVLCLKPNTGFTRRENYIPISSGTPIPKFLTDFGQIESDNI